MGIDYLTHRTEAQFYIGHSYFHGSSDLRQDYMKAIHWLKKAAVQDHPMAQGYSIEAAQNDAVAHCYLGFCYENGKGVEKDMKKAIMCYDKAADRFISYANAKGDVKGLEDITQWHIQAASSTVAQITLGFIWDYFYYHYHRIDTEQRFRRGDEQDPDIWEAGKWYTLAAEQGHAVAQCNLGRCYKSGYSPVRLRYLGPFAGSVIDRDREREEREREKVAASWFGMAAAQDYAPAQFNLAICYENGQGVAKDIKTAIDWYRKAAEQDHVEAQFNLALCYENGQGVAKDIKTAIDWYRKAASKGHAAAQSRLSNLGHVVTQSRRHLRK